MITDKQKRIVAYIVLVATVILIIGPHFSSLFSAINIEVGTNITSLNQTNTTCIDCTQNIPQTFDIAKFLTTELFKLGDFSVQYWMVGLVVIGIIVIIK